MDAFEREGSDASAMEQEEPMADFLKTDLKGAIECFEETFMQPLWASIRYVGVGNSDDLMTVFMKMWENIVALWL